MPGTIDSSAEPTNPIRSRPVWPASIRRAVATAPSSSPSSARASRRNASPAGRELDAPARPDQQREPELVLERADLLAQRRLGDVQALGGAAEVQLLRDRDEVAKLAQFHDSISESIELN